jgi:hypothetical protein
MRGGAKGGWAAAFCVAALVMGAAAAPASADLTDPLFVFTPGPGVAPNSGFEAPCGAAVDSRGNFYVADYHHHAVDVFDPARADLDPAHALISQLANADPLDSPCGLALDGTGVVYVNYFHGGVVKFTPSVFPPGPLTLYSAGPAFGGATHATGVAVDPISGNVYVDERAYVAGYDSSGAPLLDGEGEPLRIGLGSLGDGYGLAISAFPGIAGRIYVADAADNTVKSYVPAASLVEPAATIAGPGGGFVSLRDSAIAVDRVSGNVYVADNLEPRYSEAPEATIQVFSAAGAYQGHLKHNIVDAEPPGIAVDNSALVSQGRVYVTSGNSTGASVYAYLAGAATTGPTIPARSSAGEGSGGAAVRAAASAGSEASGPATNAPAPAQLGPRVTRRSRGVQRRHRARQRRHHHRAAGGRR